MARKRFYFPLVLLVALFVALGRGQEFNDRFDFPTPFANGSVPSYKDMDTLLVKYTTRIHAPSLSIALKCVARSQSQVKNDEFPDIEADSLTVASQDKIPSYSGTVPFELPSLPHMGTGTSCAFILSGYRDNPSGDLFVANLRSSKFEIRFVRDRYSYSYTYGVDGQVPNGIYPILSGTGTYESYPPPKATSTALVPTTFSKSATTASSSTTASSTEADPLSTAATSGTSNSLTTSTTATGSSDQSTSQPTQTTEEDNKGEGGGGGLSSTASAGIGAGVAIGAIAILGLGFFLWWRRRKQQKAMGSGSGSVAGGSAPAESDGREIAVAELQGKHMSELGAAEHYVRDPPKHQELGAGVERAEVEAREVGQRERFELP